MEIWQLRECLDSIAHLDPPGADLIETMIRIAEAQRWDVLKGWPDEEVQFWRNEYESDKANFRKTLKKLVNDLYSGLLKNSLHRLGSVLTMRFEDRAELTPVEQLQRQADQDNTLLKTAFAYKLVDLIEPAAHRASKLIEVVVKEPSSEEADHYLEEASQCYFFGLFTACAVMCRSLLEEALERKLPRSFAESHHSGKTDMTLGKLLYEVNNSELAPIMPAGFLKAARRVNQIGKRGAHVSRVSGDEAWECLRQARTALALLLGSVC